MSTVLLLIGVVLGAVVVAGYLWWRLIRNTTIPGRTRRWLTVAAVVLTVCPSPLMR